MKRFFIKNQEFARRVDSEYKPYIKKSYACCEACNKTPFAVEKGYLVKTNKTKKELKDEGILVSSL